LICLIVSLFPPSPYLSTSLSPRLSISPFLPAKTQCENSKQIFPEKELRGHRSQFPHSCVCERFIYSHDRSAYSAAGKYVDRSWEYINHRHMNVGKLGLRPCNSQKRNTQMGFSLQCITHKPPSPFLPPFLTSIPLPPFLTSILSSLHSISPL
jgi:hypothetical protein